MFLGKFDIYIVCNLFSNITSHNLKISNCMLIITLWCNELFISVVALKLVHGLIKIYLFFIITCTFILYGRPHQQKLHMLDRIIFLYFIMNTLYYLWRPVFKNKLVCLIKRYGVPAFKFFLKHAIFCLFSWQTTCKPGLGFFIVNVASVICVDFQKYIFRNFIWLMLFIGDLNLVFRGKWFVAHIFYLK